MTSLPPIGMGLKPIENNKEMSHHLFKVGSSLDNDDSIVKVEKIRKSKNNNNQEPQQPMKKNGNNNINNANDTPIGVHFKSPDFSIQNFYENLQNRKPGSESSSAQRRTPKPPKISMTVKKSIRYAPKVPKNNNNITDEKLVNNLYSPSAASIENLNPYGEDDHQPETSPNLMTHEDSQKAFMIATGDIKLQHQELTYTIHEILGICLSINFIVQSTGQLWTVFVPTNEVRMMISFDLLKCIVF